MANVGISEETGDVITGWDRTLQGLVICIETQIRERVQHRDFGSETESIVDRPQNQDQLVNLFVAIQDAIEPRLVNGLWYGEPCFAMTQIRADLSTPAHPKIKVTGVEFPNGHLGDFKTRGQSVTFGVEM